MSKHISYEMLVDGRFYKIIKAKNYEEAEKQAREIFPNRPHAINLVPISEWRNAKDTQEQTISKRKLLLIIGWLNVEQKTRQERKQERNKNNYGKRTIKV